jgi:hypothetical protein
MEKNIGDFMGRRFACQSGSQIGPISNSFNGTTVKSFLDKQPFYPRIPHLLAHRPCRCFVESSYSPVDPPGSMHAIFSCTTRCPGILRSQPCSLDEPLGRQSKRSPDEQRDIRGPTYEG